MNGLTFALTVRAAHDLDLRLLRVFLVLLPGSPLPAGDTLSAYAASI